MLNRLGFVIVLLLATWPASRAGSAVAQVQRGDWELTLAGIGSSDKDFRDSYAFGLRAGLGYYFTDWLELGARQIVAYSKVQDSTSFDAATQGALDLHLALGPGGRIQPFVGGNFGFFYGDNFSDELEAGPEAGIKYFVNRTTFVFVMAQYQIFISGTGGGDTTADRQYVYTIGIGFRF